MATTGTSSLGSVTIKVTPEELKSKATEVSTKINTVQGMFSDINKRIKNTKSYWIGSAGDLHRSIYEKKQPDIETILKRLKEHVTDLREIAQIYTAAEKEATAQAEVLPNDIIE